MAPLRPADEHRECLLSRVFRKSGFRFVRTVLTHNPPDGSRRGRDPAGFDPTPGHPYGLIAAYRGRIANTAGDSVLAEFGSAVDAVQCAVEARAALTEANAGTVIRQNAGFQQFGLQQILTTSNVPRFGFDATSNTRWIR
jgi:hypothetical protein